MIQSPLAGLLQNGCASRSAAFVVAGNSISWREFLMRVGGLYDFLRERKEHRWAICYDSPFEMAIALYGLWLAGKTPILPPNHLAGTINLMESGIHRVDACLGETPMPGTITQSINTLCPSSIPLHRLAMDCTVELFTSGSTGEPKRVVRPLAQLDNEICALRRLWGHHVRDSKLLANVPCRHALGFMWRVLFPLTSGAVISNHGFDGHHLFDGELRQGETAVVISTSAFWERLPYLPKLARSLHKPSLVVSSGGSLTRDAAEHIRMSLGVYPTEIYGSTEAGAIAWRRLDLGEAWRAFPEIEVFVRPHDQRLSVRSPFMSPDDWAILDDMAVEADEGFNLMGRADRVVKLEGKRLSLPEMELLLQGHPYVAQVSLCPFVPRDAERTVVAGAVVLTEAGRQALAAQGRKILGGILRGHLANHFDSMLLPRRYRFVDQLPVSESGKVTVDALLRLFQSDLH